jgi:TonB-linked SusC/RagA family outer membrane protein
MKKIRITGKKIPSFWNKSLRLMKLTFLFLVVGLMQLSASVYSQSTKLSLEMRNAKVGEVLDAIEKQSEFRFAYSPGYIDLNREVSVDIREKTIDESLRVIFAGTNVEFGVFDRHILLYPESLNPGAEMVVSHATGAQQRTVSGSVTDESGEPLPGVTVVVKGTTQGTVTNSDGQYSLSNIPDDATLQFSFVGMQTQEVEVGNQTTINVIIIEDIIGIEEVVAVGYGTMKKSDVTGSVVSIDTEDLETRPRVSVEQMLQGAAAGLTITVNQSNAEGSSNTMLVRAENSITASNAPLIILDGIPYSGNLSEINPKDISSIEILKDASSTAIYGSRGANGVILITSKRGRTGEMRVNYEGSYAFDQIINVPDLMDGATFYEAKTQRGLSTTAIEDEGYESGRSIRWVDLATQTGNKQQHNLSFSGGTEKTVFYLSMSYINSKGVAIGDEFKRYTFRINLDQKLLPWATFNTNTQYGYYDRSGNEADFSDAFQMNPLGIPFNEDGTIRMETWEDGVYSHNPLLPTLNINSDITRRFISNNSLTLDFPFAKGLSYKLNTGYDFRSRLQQTYYGRNTFSGLSDNGRALTENGYDEDWIIDNILSYNREFGNHSIFLTGLYSAQSEWSEGHNVRAQGFPNDVMYYYQNSKASLVEPSDSYQKRTHISQMVRANYTYDNRYLATFTVRRDGYSAFGEDSKFGVFPSVAVGWNMANEQFLSQAEKLDVLKLRLSYGVNGNEAVSPYSTLPTLSSFNYVNANDQTLFGFYPSRLGDPSLGWETTTSFNAGVDFVLFNNRLRGTFDTYWSNTTDLLLSKSISDVNGTGSIIQNIGETANNGVEFQLTSVNISSSDFMWTTNFNISHYNTEIVHVGLTDDAGNYVDDIDSRWFIGEPVSVNYDYVFDGIYQQDEEDTPQGDVEAGEIRYLDASGDGTVSADDRQVIGRRIPDFITSMTNTLKYKGWSLSFFLNAVSGVTKRNELLGTNDNEMRLNRYNVDFWTPENNSNEYPANERSSDINKFGMDFYRSADFIRLQDVTLSYTLPKVLVNRYKLDNVKLFVNAKNLATWTNWVGLDPEFSDQTAIPQTKSFLFGVNISL